MKIDILVDSDEFFNRLKNDIQNAKNNIYIQAMTFEADKAGEELCDLLRKSSVRDIRILIDSYIKAMISDCFLYSPRNMFNRSLRSEYKETFKLINNLNNLGIRVKLTNPLGPLFIRYPGRNHKKLVVIDSKIVYAGGFNFSDHNFLWHDMMLRIEDKDIAKFLEKDFLITWSGENQCCKQSFGSIECYLLDGKSNEKGFEAIFKTVDEAKISIFIESAYMSFPFYEKLRQARKRGVNVKLILPENNNKPIMQKYTYWEIQRSDLKLRLLKNAMTHLKAMLIDDKFLVVGSSNFDYFSYTSHQEVILVINNLDIIDQFKRRVIRKDWDSSVPWTGKTSGLIGFIRYLFMKTAFHYFVILSRR